MEQELILGRYRPLGPLGEGGFGAVTLAFDTKMARRVAIKQLPLPTGPSGRPMPRAGLAEARTAALLNHPDIVTVHEWDTDGERAYIVMEYVDGLSLADILDESGGPLDPDEVAAVLDAVAAAVAYAHENGVLHLDIKPGNVLVTRAGRIKVADFGVSALTDIGGLAHATSGTLGYMPPEQIRNQALDERTDVWALAALVYELLTNANPFDTDTPEGSLFRIETADVPAPSEFEPALPATIDDVLLTALEPVAADRYPSVPAFADALAPLLGDAEAGRASLAAFVGAALGEPDDEVYRAEGLWDRLAPHTGAITRTGAAVVSASMAWAGSTAFGLETAPLFGVTAMTALAGALAPGLGLALGLGGLVAGAARYGGWLPGLLSGIAASAFWIARGRLGRGDGFAPFAAPVLAVVRAAPALPLVSGLAFRPLPAAIAAAAAGALTVAGSSATGGAVPFLRIPWQAFAYPWSAEGLWGAVGTPGTGSGSGPPAALAMIAVPLVWALAAAACSLMAGRQTRLAAAGGVLAGAALMSGGYALWAALPGASFAPLAWAPDVAAAAALALGAIALGPPIRESSD